MSISRKLTTIMMGVLLLSGLFLVQARGADPPETSVIASTPGGDISDVYVFPSPLNAGNVVLAMTVHPLIPGGMGPSIVFDPNILYQFKIDTTGDAVEDLVIQARFTGTGSTQKVQIAGPVKPAMTGLKSTFMTPDSVSGTINAPFTLSNGIRVFAGAREDPLFFDINQFFTLLPDRANPLEGPTFTNTLGQSVSTTPTDPNALTGVSFRPIGQDFLKGLNVMAIVVEVPKTLLTSTGTGKIRVWCTTSR